MMTYMNRSTRIAVVSALTMLAHSIHLDAGAQTPDRRGREVAEAADARDAGWRDDRVAMTMTLRNRAGQESIRRLRRLSLEVDGEGDRSLIIFDAPRDVEGPRCCPTPGSWSPRRPVALASGDEAGEANLVGQPVGPVPG
jgi:hypothetical protein